MKLEFSLIIDNVKNGLFNISGECLRRLGIEWWEETRENQTLETDLFSIRLM